jgi:hypothetical protein
MRGRRVDRVRLKLVANGQGGEAGGSEASGDERGGGV